MSTCAGLPPAWQPNNIDSPTIRQPAVYQRRQLRISCQLVLLLLGAAAGDLHSEETDTVAPPDQYEVFGKSYRVLPSSLGYLEIGIASWYGTKFHGRLTSLGETYDMHGMTAAHKSLPLPTVVKVTNLDTGESATLRVNDRGPFHDDRLIDLSYAAAKALGFQSRGTAPVVVEALDTINHPDMAPSRDAVTDGAITAGSATETSVRNPGGAVYLQVGAFSLQRGAEKRLAEVRQALQESTPTRILRSETEEHVLYKIWAGPIWSEREEREIAAVVARRNLGGTLRVRVD